MQRTLRHRDCLLLLAAGLASGVGVAGAARAGGDLSPARDLRGTWVSPLRGKGYQLSGRWDVPGSGSAQVVESGDIRLVVKRVAAEKVGVTTVYKAYGTITFSNKVTVATMTVTTAKGSVRLPPRKIPGGAAGFSTSVVLSVSSSGVTFPPIAAVSATVSMQGRFTTDLMSGPMTETFHGAAGLPGVAGAVVRPLTGQFHLSRVRGT